MKRFLFWSGMAAAVCSALSFIISRWFWWVGGSVMDGESSFYTEVYRKYSTAVKCGWIFLAAAVILLGLYFLLFRKKQV